MARVHRTFGKFGDREDAKLALLSLANFVQRIRYWLIKDMKYAAPIFRGTTQPTPELSGEFLFCATRQVRSHMHPVEHAPLAPVEWTSFVTPVDHRARANCVFLSQLPVSCSKRDRFLRSQLIAECMDCAEDYFFFGTHRHPCRKSQEILLYRSNHCIP